MSQLMGYRWALRGNDDDGIYVLAPSLDDAREIVAKSVVPHFAYNADGSWYDGDDGDLIDAITDTVAKEEPTETAPVDPMVAMIARAIPQAVPNVVLGHKNQVIHRLVVVDGRATRVPDNDPGMLR